MSLKNCLIVGIVAAALLWLALVIYDSTMFERQLRECSKARGYLVSTGDGGFVCAGRVKR